MRLGLGRVNRKVAELGLNRFGFQKSAWMTIGPPMALDQTPDDAYARKLGYEIYISPREIVFLVKK